MKIYKESPDAMLSIVRQYTQQTTDMEIERRVYDIIENVRANGDAALREYSEKFDGVKLDDFKVDQSIIDAAWDNLPEDLKHALLVAKKNITEFHSREIEQGFVDMDTPGITRGQKVTPLARVGLTEEDAINKGYTVKTKEMLVATMPRAHVNDYLKGAFKIVVNADNDLILGATLYSQGAEELINLIKMAMDNNIPYTYFKNQIFTHPTMAENLNDLCNF